MIFLVNNKKYAGATAAQIVSEMARETDFELSGAETVRDFLRSERIVLADFVPSRELDFNEHLTVEMLAFNYLCLLDEYNLGKLIVAPPEPPEICVAK